MSAAKGALPQVSEENSPTAHFIVTAWKDELAIFVDCSHCFRGEDITAILHHVNDDVGLKEGSSRMPGAIKQMPEVRFTLRKKVVLTPN